MLNLLWVVMVTIAVAVGALTGNLDAVVKSSTDAAKSAAELAIGLVGVMAFWLGMMRVLHHSGILRRFALLLKPVMKWLFPSVPADHPAMSMMILNFISNMLGLANAATPFGIKAMIELNKLNKEKGTATNAMVLFLAINTAGLAILPTGMIGLRASLGAVQPGSILGTTFLATCCSTLTAILAVKWLQRWKMFHRKEDVCSVYSEAGEVDTSNLSEVEKLINYVPEGLKGLPRLWAWFLIGIVVLTLSYALNVEAMQYGWGSALNTLITRWMLVVLMIGIILFGYLRGVKVYDAIVEGGKEGFDIALKIIPYLVAILVAVQMLRAAGALDLGLAWVRPFVEPLGIPAEVLPMAFMRTLSGSGAFAMSAELMKVHGPDSLIGNIVATIQGSSETTFYVLALYFGAVQIKNIRHTLACCLIADLAGALASVYFVRLFL